MGGERTAGPGGQGARETRGRRLSADRNGAHRVSERLAAARRRTKEVIKPCPLSPSCRLFSRDGTKEMINPCSCSPSCCHSTTPPPPTTTTRRTTRRTTTTVHSPHSSRLFSRTCGSSAAPAQPPRPSDSRRRPPSPAPSRRRDCHSAAIPSSFSRCFNSDGERASAK